MRQPLIKALGTNGFRLLYTAVAAAGIVWVVMAYNAAPRIALWDDSPALRHLALVIMPFACILVVAGFTTQNVTMVAGEGEAADAAKPDNAAGYRDSAHVKTFYELARF